MASSRGRERTQQRGPRVFVFGSSTPRDLSHMSKIPTHLRKYDARIAKESNGGPKLSEYMQKARSLTREDKANERSWAFGSSTPRDFAHLTALKPAQRRYDAVLPKKSNTTPNFTATPIWRQRSATTAPVARQAPKQDSRSDQIERLIKDDEVSSEPDFVQDRGTFLNELREMKENQARQEAAKQADSAKEVEEVFEQPKEIGSETVQPQVVPPNVHTEETAHAASHQLAQPVLQDQVVVSNLEEDQTEGDAVEMVSQKVGELVQKEETMVRD